MYWLTLPIAYRLYLQAYCYSTTTNTISIPVGAMYLHARMFCAFAHSHGCNKFIHARTFFSLADITSILMFVNYDVFTYKNVLYTRSVLLLPWVQCQSLKPVLS